MAVYSMTGFGQAQASVSPGGNAGDIAISVEIKSVNSRFLDVNCRMPSIYSSLELEITKFISSKLKRGRVDVNISRKVTDSKQVGVRLNKNSLSSHINVIDEALQAAKVNDQSIRDQAVLQVLQRKEVVEAVYSDINLEGEREKVFSTIEGALDALIDRRAKEGKSLAQALAEHLDGLGKGVKNIQKISPNTVDDYRERLQERLAKLEPTVSGEPERVAQEVAILAEKIDISEELSRLESHADPFHPPLGKGEGGRKLEFLLQEMVREVNTIGSKAQHKEITSLVIEAKSNLEKLREQALNIE